MKLLSRSVLVTAIIIGIAVCQGTDRKALSTTVDPSFTQLEDCSQWTATTVAEGVIWKHRCYIGDQYGGNQTVNVIDIDLNVNSVKLDPVQCAVVNGQQAYERVSSMAERTSALAGINGGFFCDNKDDICSDNTPCPPGARASSLLKIDGNTVSYNCKAMRTTFGLNGKGNPIITQVAASKGWPVAVNAIGAGPNLVSTINGKHVPNITNEGFPWVNQKAPRTAVAKTDDRHLILVTVDGRQPPKSVGMDLPTLAKFLINELNAATAMNFDGGGSTTMYVKGHGVVNSPSDRSERPVYDGLFIYPKKPH